MRKAGNAANISMIKYQLETVKLDLLLLNETGKLNNKQLNKDYKVIRS